MKRPVPDNSDVDMGSPPAPALQGASRMTGGIFRGKAYGNIANHADFPDLAVDAVPTLLPMLNMVMPFQLIWHLTLLSNFQFVFSS